MLYTVWENLFTNAIKYNRTAGTIDLTVQHTGEKVAVAVHDTGIGLTAEEREHIFDRFYRADQARTRTTEGTGLGLSIVQQVITMHDGNIAVESRPGEGTIFTVTLPAL